MLNLESRWVPELAWMHDGTLEMLVYAEKVDAVRDAVIAEVVVSENYNEVRAKSKGTPFVREAMQQRMQRRITTLHPQQRVRLLFAEPSLQSWVDDTTTEMESLQMG